MAGFLKAKLRQYLITVGPWTELDELTAGALIYHKIFGQQVLDPNWKWKKYALLHASLLALIVYVFFGTWDIFSKATDAVVIAEAGYTLVIMFITPVKFFTVIHNRYVFRELYLATKMELIPFIKESGNFETTFAMAKKIVRIIYAMAIIPVSNYELIAFWNYAHGNFNTLSRTTATLMPQSTPYSEVAWVLHTIFLGNMATTVIIDMWYVLLIYFLCSSSEYLIQSLQLIENNRSDLYQEALGSCLKNFYKRHVVFVRFLSKMNTMYKWLALIPLCNAIMCVCLILLLVSKAIPWQVGPTVLPMLAEIFTYNWFGEQIRTKATLINNALLNFDWLSLNARDKKSYYIIVSYVNKADFGIKTAFGNDLSLVTMSIALRITYQMFTVMQSVE